MTCEWCDGRKTMRIVDSWMIIKLRNREPLYIDGVPCPGCCEQEAGNWLMEKIKQDGPPYPDSDEGCWTLWARESGDKIAVLKPEGIVLERAVTTGKQKWHRRTSTSSIKPQYFSSGSAAIDPAAPHPVRGYSARLVCTRRSPHRP